jgi:hypothetical protein
MGCKSQLPGSTLAFCLAVKLLKSVLFASPLGVSTRPTLREHMTLGSGLAITQSCPLFKI